MHLIEIKDEDCINYKKISMFIALPYCSGKCYKDLGLDCSICQNDELRKSPIINFNDNDIVTRYSNNPLTSSIVFGGLEPLDSFNELVNFIKLFRETCNDDIVIYTGYKKEEIKEKIEILKQFKNIILKIGRYIPNKSSRFDKVLGVSLVSDNQYGVKIS